MSDIQITYPAPPCKREDCRAALAAAEARAEAAEARVKVLEQELEAESQMEDEKHNLVVALRARVKALEDAGRKLMAAAFNMELTPTGAVAGANTVCERAQDFRAALEAPE